MYYNVIHHHTPSQKRMPETEIYFLEWDESNEQHIRDHGISPAEVRELLSGTVI